MFDIHIMSGVLASLGIFDPAVFCLRNNFVLPVSSSDGKNIFQPATGRIAVFFFFIHKPEYHEVSLDVFVKMYFLRVAFEENHLISLACKWSFSR